MPISRGMRLINSIESGATNATALETLLADVGRRSEFSHAVYLQSQVRRILDSPLLTNTVFASGKATEELSKSKVAIDLIQKDSYLKDLAFRAGTRSAIIKLMASRHADFSNWLDYIIWTPVTLPGNISNNKVTAGNGKFLVSAFSSTTYYTSEDGITWTTRTAPLIPNAVGFGAGLFIIAGLVSSNYQIYTSPDGITWTARTTPNISGQTPYSIAYGNGAILISSGTNSSSYHYSVDGINWVLKSLPNSANFQKINFNDGIFYLSTNSTTNFYFSFDGINWNTRTAPASFSSSDIAYGNGTFIICKGTTVYTSTDYGATWTTRTPGGGFNAENSTFIQGLFICPNGVSADGINWIRKSIGHTGAYIVIKDGLLLSTTSNTSNTVYLGI